VEIDINKIIENIKDTIDTLTTINNRMNFYMDEIMNIVEDKINNEKD